MPEKILDNSIDYDLHGHCVVCHKNMITNQVVDNEVITRFLPDYDELTYLLDDGSKMRVATCRTCKYDLIKNDSKEEQKKIMDTVKRGWKRETDLLAIEKKHGWSREKADAHMKKYNKKNIVSITENKTEQYLREKLLKFKKDK